jgi:hypothetical protein
MTDDERVAAILDAVLVWEKAKEESADAWHYEDYENIQREAWTSLTAKVSKIVRKDY